MRGYEVLEQDFDREQSGRAYRKKGILLQRTKTIKAGDMMDVEIYPVLDVETTRSVRAGRTPEKQKRVNRRNAVKKLQRLLNANFGEGDLLVHLTMEKTCAERDFEKAKRNFMAKLQRRAKKAGVPLRYVQVVELTGAESRKRYHIHMVMGGGWIDRDAVEKLWGHGLARVDRVQYQEKGLSGFAAYITQRKETQEKLMRRAWACSKGLKRPTETRSDSRFSRRAAMQVTQTAYADAKKMFEKRYPGYTLLEEPRIVWSDLAPGAYIYATMRRTDSMR